MTKGTFSQSKSISTILYGWLKLTICFLLLLGFLFYLGPWIADTDIYRPIVKAIDLYGIDPNAYYYSDVEQCSEGGLFIRTSIENPPTGGTGKK